MKNQILVRLVVVGAIGLSGFRGIADQGNHLNLELRNAVAVSHIAFDRNRPEIIKAIHLCAIGCKTAEEREVVRQLINPDPSRRPMVKAAVGVVESTVDLTGQFIPEVKPVSGVIKILDAVDNFNEAATAYDKAKNKVTLDRDTTMPTTMADIDYLRKSGKLDIINDLLKKSEGVDLVEGKYTGDIDSKINGIESRQDLVQMMNQQTKLGISQAVAQNKINGLGQDLKTLLAQQAENRNKELTKEKKEQVEANWQLHHQEFDVGVTLFSYLAGKTGNANAAKNITALGRGYSDITSAFHNYFLNGSSVLLVGNIFNAAQTFNNILNGGMDPQQQQMQQLFEMLADIQKSLDRIETKLDGLTDLIVRNYKNVMGAIGDLQALDTEILGEVIQIQLNQYKERDRGNEYKYLTYDKSVTNFQNQCVLKGKRSGCHQLLQNMVNDLNKDILVYNMDESDQAAVLREMIRPIDNSTSRFVRNNFDPTYFLNGAKFLSPTLDRTSLDIVPNYVAWMNTTKVFVAYLKANPELVDSSQDILSDLKNTGLKILRFYEKTLLDPKFHLAAAQSIGDNYVAMAQSYREFDKQIKKDANTFAQARFGAMPGVISCNDVSQYSMRPMPNGDLAARLPDEVKVAQFLGLGTLQTCYYFDIDDHVGASMMNQWARYHGIMFITFVPSEGAEQYGFSRGGIYFVDQMGVKSSGYRSAIGRDSDRNVQFAYMWDGADGKGQVFASFIDPLTPTMREGPNEIAFRNTIVSSPQSAGAPAQMQVISDNRSLISGMVAKYLRKQVALNLPQAKFGGGSFGVSGQSPSVFNPSSKSEINLSPDSQRAMFQLQGKFTQLSAAYYIYAGFEDLAVPFGNQVDEKCQQLLGYDAVAGTDQATSIHPNELFNILTNPHRVMTDVNIIAWIKHDAVALCAPKSLNLGQLTPLLLKLQRLSAPKKAWWNLF